MGFMDPTSMFGGDSGGFSMIPSLPGLDMMGVGGITGMPQKNPVAGINWAKLMADADKWAGSSSLPTSTSAFTPSPRPQLNYLSAPWTAPANTQYTQSALASAMSPNVNAPSQGWRNYAQAPATPPTRWGI